MDYIDARFTNEDKKKVARGPWPIGKDPGAPSVRAYPPIPDPYLSLSWGGPQPSTSSAPETASSSAFPAAGQTAFTNTGIASIPAIPVPSPSGGFTNWVKGLGEGGWDAIKSGAQTAWNPVGQALETAWRPVGQALETNPALSRGLMQAGLTMLAQKPSQYPITMGESLGTGGLAGLNAYDEEIKRQEAVKQRQLQAEELKRQIGVQQQELGWKGEEAAQKAAIAPSQLLESQNKAFSTERLPATEAERLVIGTPINAESLIGMSREKAYEAVQKYIGKDSKPLTMWVTPEGKKTAPGTPGATEIPASIEVFRPKGEQEIPYGYGQMKNTITGKITTVPEKPEMQTEKEKQQTARIRVAQNLTTMRDLYDQLDKMGAITSTTTGTWENLIARIGSSGIGQMGGKAIATEAQSLRNQIDSLRPLIINDMRQAAQIGARGMDSEKELAFYLQAATDTMKDVQANRAAINVLSAAYGLGDPILSKEERLTKMQDVWKAKEEARAAGLSFTTAASGMPKAGGKITTLKMPDGTTQSFDETGKRVQ